MGTTSLYDRERNSKITEFRAFLTDPDETFGIRHLDVTFSPEFPRQALVEAISSALHRHSDSLIPSPEVKEIGVYVRLWASYTLEIKAGLTARDALREWNNIIARLESAGFVYSNDHGKNGPDVAKSTYTPAPLSTALAWNLDDAEGATVGSGETQYSRTKKIIGQRITALENALKS